MCCLHKGVAATTDPEGHSRGCFDLATVPQQQSQSEMSSQTCACYAMGPPQVSFLFQI